MQQLGLHVTILTNAYEELLKSVNGMIDVSNACEGSGRAHSLIHAEAEQKRKAGHRWDRFESRIESLIQGRSTSRISRNL